ncbi:MAG: phosphodiester glycosidase family protein [Ruminococcaceae bacterium]|nr:phosphodiester glycosidase family protein [Oscillospiraceae bacterium]
MKKLFAFVLTALLLLGTLPTSAAPLCVTETKTLIQGVTYTHMERLSENGWQDIYVVQADLNEPHLKFDVLNSASGKSYLQNTYDMAVEADAVAAINADFFAAKRGESGRGSAIGLEITDGVLHTSPAAYESMNVLYQPKEDDTLYFNQFTYQFTVTAPDGTSESILVINKYDDLRGVVMYTPDWGAETPGSGNDVLEIVVTDGVVTDKRWDHGPAQIPENGYVLSSNLTINTFLDDHLNVGDPVTLEVTTLPNFNNLQTAVGGGGMILVDGQVPKSFSHTISGLQPRSAVGIDKTGKIITLAAVDGRRSEAVGMTQTQLGYLMAELGCYNAMNLDGGGSTLLAAKDENGHSVLNQPSDGYKRPVTNSIGILAENLQKPVLSAVQLSADDENLFLGTTRWLRLEGLDQYGRVLKNAITEPIEWLVTEGSGSVTGDLLRADTTGHITVRGSYGGFSDEITLQVLDTPHRIEAATTDIRLSPGESKSVFLTGWDANGHKALIYPRDMTMTVLNTAVAKMNGNALQGLSTGSTVVTASLGDVSANMVATVGDAEPTKLPKNAVIPDSAQVSREPVDEGSFRFTVFGNTRTPVKLFDLYMMNGVVNAVQKESDMNFFVGNDINKKLLTNLGDSLKTADGYSLSTHQGNTFITMKNAYGKSLYASDSKQWEKLRADIEAISGGNLFVFLNDHNISPADIELTLFKKLMEEAAEKCSSVYVFAGGYVNETVIENGVRYITTAGIFPSIGLKPPATNISYVKYYLVTVNGDTVTYETKGIVK